MEETTLFGFRFSAAAIEKAGTTIPPPQYQEHVAVRFPVIAPHRRGSTRQISSYAVRGLGAYQHRPRCRCSRGGSSAAPGSTIHSQYRYFVGIALLARYHYTPCQYWTLRSGSVARQHHTRRQHRVPHSMHVTAIQPYATSESVPGGRQLRV
eukprot:1883900-Rhodomonas_salina.1